MTTNQIRIAIAEECGWTNIMSHGDDLTNPSCIEGTNPNTGKWTHLPNYPTSPDACREFEEKLEEDEILYYTNNLKLIIPAVEETWMNEYNLICATTLQRCEAFLRLKGKWIDK